MARSDGIGFVKIQNRIDTINIGQDKNNQVQGVISNIHTGIDQFTAGLVWGVTLS